MIEQLQRIEEKLKQLLKVYYQAQKEVLRLQKVNSNITEQLMSQEEEILQLRQKMDSAKIGAGNIDDQSKKELTSRINGYLNDIDKCLASLNS